MLYNDTLGSSLVINITTDQVGDDVLALQQRQVCLLHNFIMHTLVAGVICIIGFVGNTVSFAVLGKDKQSPVATYMLQWLAFTDNAFLALWALHFSFKSLFKFSATPVHISWVFIRVYTYPILFIVQSATIWLTVVIAASRYVSVCMPYKAGQIVNMPNTKKAVYGTWIFSITYNLPRFFEAYLHPDTVNGTTTYKYTPFLIANSYYVRIYFDVMYYITSFVLPLLLLAILNSRLTMAYRIIRNRRAQMMRTRTNTASSSDQDNNITLIMIIVVLVFMLTQAPARLVQILWEYKSSNCDSVQFIVIEISKILEVLNSSSNFFIYCALRAKFREALWGWLCQRRTSSTSNGARNGTKPHYKFILLRRKSSADIKRDDQSQTQETYETDV